MSNGWPDIVLCIAHIVSMIALLPMMVDSRSQVPRHASVPKALAAIITLPAHWALNNIYTFWTVVLMCFAWFIVVWLRSPNEIAE